MSKLTPREQQVLELSSYGYSAKEIAYELDITSTTVKVHQRNIHLKTGLQNDRETTVCYWVKKAHVSLMSFPEKLRRRIAAALLVLSLYGLVYQTLQLVATCRNFRTVQAQSSTRARGKKLDDYIVTGL